MKKTSTNKDDQDIPELKREQLGVGVRGKYYKQFKQGSNVVVLQPKIQKVFPTSEAVNKALASMLVFTLEAQTLTTANEHPTSELQPNSIQMVKQSIGRAISSVALFRISFRWNVNAIVAPRVLTESI